MESPLFLFLCEFWRGVYQHMERSLHENLRRILIGIFVASVTLPCHANDLSLNYCILNGLKGVSSNAAAYLVRKACEDKKEERRQQMVNALTQEWGEEIGTNSVTLAKSFNIESAGFASIEITNSVRMPERTLTYVKLSVEPASGNNQLCDISRATRYSYKITLKPENSIKLLFPYNSKAFCTSIEALHGRPVAWKDFSISGSVNPLDKDPFSDPTLIAPFNAVELAPAASAAPAVEAWDGKGFNLAMLGAGDLSQLNEWECYNHPPYDRSMNRTIAKCLYHYATKDKGHDNFRKWLIPEKKSEIAKILGLPRNW